MILNNLFIQWQQETGEVMGKLVHLIKTSGKVTWFIDILVKLSPNIPGCFFMVCQPNNYSYRSTNIDRSMNNWHKNRSNQSEARPGKKKRGNLQWIEAQSRINNWFQTWECCVLNFKVQPSRTYCGRNTWSQNECWREIHAT